MKVITTMKMLIGAALILPGIAIAGEKFYNSSDALIGVFNNVKCSTGLTCSNISGKLSIVAAQTLTTPLSIKAADSTDSSLTLQADNSDDNGDDWKIASVASNDSLTISNDTSGSQVAKFTMTTGGNVSMVGTLTGDGGDALSGFLQKQVAATATTITAAQCGSSFINSGAVQMELPEASAVLGCRLTFITGNASNFDINPDNADQILVETNAAGDAMRNATLGDSITIEAISASQWAPISAVGTWSDIN